jgi:PKD repeat protein
MKLRYLWIIGIISVCLLVGIVSAGYVWTEVNASGGWVSRDYHNVAILSNGHIILMGGQTDTDYKNDTWRSTNNGSTWQLMNASPGWSARMNPSAVANGNKIILTGGFSLEGGDYRNDTWVSTDEGATWQLQNASSGWAKRYDHSSVALPNGKIVLMGGASEVGNYNDTWLSTDNGSTWTEVNASGGWLGRLGFTSVVLPDNSIVISGGQTVTVRVNDTWRSTDNGTTWVRQSANAGWEGRYDLSDVALSNGNIVLFGGVGTEFHNDTWVSTDKGVTWIQTNNALWSTRNAQRSIVLPDNSILLLGGSTETGLKNDTWKGIFSLPVANFDIGQSELTGWFYDKSTGGPTGWAWFFGDEPYNQSWTLQNASPGWIIRDYTSLISLPDGDIVLMGGQTNDGVQLNDTWLSVDQGVTWTLQNASSEWRARRNFASASLSDGSIIIVGGLGGGWYNDTWRSTDKGASWTLQNASPGWLARILPGKLVVLPDDTILIVGGYTNAPPWYLNDTWISTDKGVTWQLQSGNAAWTARGYHSIVALPDESIVIMGGDDGTVDNYINDTWITTNQGVTWTLQNASSGWGKRIDGGVVTLVDGSIFLIGGDDWDGAPMNDTWRSTDKGMTWTNITGSQGVISGYGFGIAVLPDGSIITSAGWGYSEGYVGDWLKNETWRFNPVGSSSQNPEHIYTSPGTYNVTLQIFDGFNTSKRVNPITVTAPLPVADFEYSNNLLDATFTDTSYGSPTGWAWFFGDEPYTQSWVQQNESAGWTTRNFPSGVALPDGSIVLMGGVHSGYNLNDTWRSTDKGITWQLMNASSGWSARLHQCSVALSDGNIVMMGGYYRLSGLSPWIYSNDTWRSTDEGATWVLQNASSGWAGRYDQSCVVLSDDSILLTGGWYGDFEGGAMNDTWRSTDEGATWTQQSANAGWSARSDHTTVKLDDNSIVLMGGYVLNNDIDIPEHAMNDTWLSTDNGSTWQLKNASSGWAEREWAPAVTMPDNSIVLLGGGNSTDTTLWYNDVWRSTDEGATWTNITTNPLWTPRYGGFGVILPDGSIVFGGGYDNSDDQKNDTWRLDPAGSHLQNPDHTYASFGIYNVTLQVYNAFDYNRTRKQITIEGGSPVNFTSDVTEGSSPLTVHFTDTSTNSPTVWAWFFGDTPFIKQWQLKSENPGWTGRAEHNLVRLPDGSIVILAGYDENTDFNDTWRSTDNGSTWIQQTANAEWYAREIPTTVALPNGHIVLMGGYAPDRVNDTWQSIDQGAHWTLMNASPGWTARGYTTSVALPNGHIVLMGGHTTVTSPNCYANDTWRSIDEGATWQLMNESPGWIGREDPTSAVLSDGSILLIGGYNPNHPDSHVLNDTWRSTDEGATWVQQTAAAEWTARDYPQAAALSDGRIIMMDGDGDDDENQTWVSSDQGVHWTQLMDAPFTGRYEPSIVAMPDDSILYVGGGFYFNDTWQFKVPDSMVQNPVHTYTGTNGQTFNVSLEAGGLTDHSYTKKTDYITITGGGHLLSLTFEDSTNFTVIQNVTITDNHGASFTAVDGTFNHTYTGEVALLIHAEGYNDLTVQYSMSEDYTGIVLLEPAMAVTNIHQTTYFPHLVRISCMNYLGTPISDMSVTAVVVESTSPYSWLSDIFGINTNQTEIVNTTLKGSTDSDGSIAFMMVENLKYKLEFSKPSEGIAQTNYIYPKEGDYAYVFWSEAPPSVSQSVGIAFWNQTNLSNASYMDLGIHYTDSGTTTDWLAFTVYYENNTVMYTKNATNPNDWNVSAPVYMGHGVAYIWGVRANNTRYADQIVQAQVIRFGNSPQKVPYTLGDVWNQWIALGIIGLVALLSGRVSIKYISAIVVLLTLFFSYIGWLAYTWLLLSFIVFLGVMFYFRYAEQESDI